MDSATISAIATIVSSLISAGVALLICTITNRAQAKSTESLVLYRLKELEEKQNAHNNLITRVTELSIRGEETRKDVDECFKRLRELEKK